MSTKTEATIADLYLVPSKAELVNGEIVYMSPTGGIPGFGAAAILASLHAYSRATKRGAAIGDNVAFVVDLPHRKSFCPDCAFHVGPLSMKFIDGAPRFAVEVRSEWDYGSRAERQMADKRADYFAAGTLAVWDVDLLDADVVRLYRTEQPTEAVFFRRGEMAHAEPAVPGWQMPVDDLFPPEPMA